MTARVLFAFTEEQAARLAKVSSNQLAYWDRTGFFQPSLADDNRRLKFSRNYSFVDVVGLRTLSMLINEYGVPMRYLRRVRECLRRPQELWADTTLYVLGKRVYLEEPETAQYRDPTSGQLALKNIPLRRVIGEIEREIEESRNKRANNVSKVTQNKFVVGNSKVIDGTRIPIAAIKSYLDEGISVKNILKEFPTLTEEDVDAAIAHLGRGAA